MYAFFLMYLKSILNIQYNQRGRKMTSMKYSLKHSHPVSFRHILMASLVILLAERISTSMAENRKYTFN